MADFEIIRRTHLPATEAWERLTDWERHGAFIPFTTVTLTGLIRRDVGESFVGRTSLGPLHFDDPMEVTHWQPPEGDEPGVCRIVKRGQVIIGWAVLTVSPDENGTTVLWQEDAGFRAAGSLLNWPNRIAGRHLFTKLVDGLLDDRA